MNFKVRRPRTVKKGITLVELMIVFMVMSVIMGMGIGGLVTFRNNLDMESYYSDIQLAVKTTQNNARNSRDVVESTNATESEYAEYYILKFDVTNTSAGSGSSVKNEYSYTQSYLPNAETITPLPLPYEKVSNLANDNVKFEFVEDDRVLTVTDCYFGIAFKRLTGDLVFLRPYRNTVQEINTGTCILSISHNDIPGVEKEIKFNADTNKISYE